MITISLGALLLKIRTTFNSECVEYHKQVLLHKTILGKLNLVSWSRAAAKLHKKEGPGQLRDQRPRNEERSAKGIGSQEGACQSQLGSWSLTSEIENKLLK